LYYKSEKPEVDFFVYDGIVPQINMAAMDRLPLAKAKRLNARAFRQPQSKEVVKRLKAVKIDGQHLESENQDHPIGYLPGDEVEMTIDEPLFMAMLTPCSAFCSNLCTSCTPAGNACDGQGNCKTGRDLIPLIYSQLSIPYTAPTNGNCVRSTDCGVVKTYSLGPVTHNCDSIDMKGAVTEEGIEVIKNTCLGNVDITIGLACTVTAGNILKGLAGICTDTYGICVVPALIPANGCEVVWKQQVRLDNYVCTFHTVQFVFTKTPGSCTATVDYTSTQGP
jgi:hypothetical protein